MSALYVYAIVPSDAEEIAISGIGRAPAYVVREGAVAAVVHDLPAAEPYRGSDDEIREAIAEHAAVVEAAWNAAGTVLPVTFDMLIAPSGATPAVDRLREWLRTEGEQLAAKLAALRGMTELKVEIAIDPALLPPSAEIEQARADLETRSAGARRLFERKLTALERDHAAARAAELYAVVRRALAGASQDLTEHRRYRPDAPLVPLIAVSVLVRRDQVDEVGKTLSGLRDAHRYLAIRFLGPWPPYSFADLASQLPWAVPEDAARRR